MVFLQGPCWMRQGTYALVGMGGGGRRVRGSVGPEIEVSSSAAPPTSGSTRSPCPAHRPPLLLLVSHIISKDGKTECPIFLARSKHVNSNSWWDKDYGTPCKTNASDQSLFIDLSLFNLRCVISLQPSSFNTPPIRLALRAWFEFLC